MASADVDRCCRACQGPRRCAVEGCEAEHLNACGADASSAGWRCFAHEQSNDGLRVWHEPEGNTVIAYNRTDCVAILATEWGYKSIDDFLEDDIAPEDAWLPWPTDKILSLTVELDQALTLATVQLGPGEAIVRVGRSDDCGDLPVVYHLEDDGRIFLRTERRLPAQWIKDRGRGFFGGPDW